MKIFWLSFIVLLLTACSNMPLYYTGVEVCPQYSCNATGATGTFCAISSSGYRAYPSSTNTSGYRDCINRTTGLRGVWSEHVIPQENISMSTDHCIRKDQISFCIYSTNITEDAYNVEVIRNASNGTGVLL